MSTARQLTPFNPKTRRTFSEKGERSYWWRIISVINASALPLLRRPLRTRPLQGGANEAQAVIAEIHVGAVDEHCRRAEAAATDQLLGVGAQPVLDRRRADTGEKVCRIDASACAH